MTVSEYSREGEKAFKYTEIIEENVNLNNLFGDLVDHWIRYHEWDQERDEIYPEEGVLFKGFRDEKEIRLKQLDDNKIRIEYGIETEVDNSLDYVESVWKDEIQKLLERNSTSEIEDYHVLDRTFANLFEEQRRVKA